MDKRIFGIETEYGVTCTLRGQRRLSPDEVARFARHLILPEVGMEGQKRLKAASVLCVGTGGLGSPLLLYLAAAGVGTLGIADFDRVDSVLVLVRKDEQR